MSSAAPQGRRVRLPKSPPVLPHVGDSLDIPKSIGAEYFRPKSDGHIGDLLSPDKTAHMWTAGRGRTRGLRKS
jgi:hypothetical protein